MEKIEIRPATQSDLPTLLDFEQGIIAFERPFDSSLKSGQINYYDISAMINATDAEVLVAELEGELIGSGYAKIVNSKLYCSHDQHAYLGFMYVSPKHRGKRVNKLIVDGLIEWSRKQDLSEVRLEVYHQNEGAIRAYEKAGFGKNILEMRQNLRE